MAPGRAGPRELQREGQSLCPALGCGPSWAIDDHCPRVRQLLTMRHTHWRFQGDRWTRSETCSGVTGPRLPVNSWAACTQMKQGSSCARSFQVGSRATHLPSVPLAPAPRVWTLRSSPLPALDCIHFHRLPELDLGPSAQLGFGAQCALSQGWLQPSSSRGDAGLELRASRQRDSNPVHPVHTRRGSRSSVVLAHPPLGESLQQSPQASFPTRDTVQGRCSASG